MNRIALHQSTVHPLDPVALVEVARGAGLDSIGLRVAAVADVEPWWSRGIGSPMLPDLIDALLAHRVTVLDVGRVPLGPELCVMDIGHPYGRVLELGTRLGAQFVTVRAGKPADDPAEFFARLAELAARYHLRPLLSPAAGTAVATLEQAAATVAGTGGGVVLDVVPGRDDAAAVDETIVELGDLLGYVRVPARALDHTVTPGLLATLPPQVPIAIGGAPGSTATATQPIRHTDPGTTGLDVPGHIARATALRAAVDTLLRHPQADRTHEVPGCSGSACGPRSARRAAPRARGGVLARVDGQLPGQAAGRQHQRRHHAPQRRLLQVGHLDAHRGDRRAGRPQHRDGHPAPARLQLPAAGRHAVQPDALQRAVDAARESSGSPG